MITLDPASSFTQTERVLRGRFRDRARGTVGWGVDGEKGYGGMRDATGGLSLDRVDEFENDGVDEEGGRWTRKRSVLGVRHTARIRRRGRALGCHG